MRANQLVPPRAQPTPLTNNFLDDIERTLHRIVAFERGFYQMLKADQEMTGNERTISTSAFNSR
jgi:hypothetical protein